MRLSLVALMAVGAAAQSVEDGAYPAKPFDFCVQNEGKGGQCGAAPAAVAFAELLRRESWLKIGMRGVGGEMKFDISQKPTAVRRVTWKTVGRMGPWTVRRLDHQFGGHPSATMLAARVGPDQWVPLFVWYGGMPEPRLVNAKGKTVLLVEKDWGGNIPMVETWAWVADEAGLVRVNVEGAVAAAIEKVGAGYKGYWTGMGWTDLRMGTGVWKGKHPGKIGVEEAVEAEFQWNGPALEVVRATREHIYNKTVLARWPK